MVPIARLRSLGTGSRSSLGAPRWRGGAVPHPPAPPLGRIRLAAWHQIPRVRGLSAAEACPWQLLGARHQRGAAQAFFCQRRPLVGERVGCSHDPIYGGSLHQIPCLEPRPEVTTTPPPSGRNVATDGHFWPTVATSGKRWQLRRSPQASGTPAGYSGGLAFQGRIGANAEEANLPHGTPEGGSTLRCEGQCGEPFPRFDLRCATDSGRASRWVARRAVRQLPKRHSPASPSSRSDS